MAIIDHIREAFSNQAKACDELGSAFTADLCRMFADNLTDETAVGAMCLGWAGDPGPSGDSVPLRLCGGLHALVLGARDEALADLYPPRTCGGLDWDVLENALIEHEAFLLEWMALPPQTNEVSRAGVRWPSLTVIAAVAQLPLDLLEVGASAGLNLNLDRFRYTLGAVQTGERASPLHLKPQWKGNQVAPAAVDIRHRAGCDISPLDIGDPVQALRLRSYVWPDQDERKQRLEAALTIADSNPVVVERSDAVSWLREQLDGIREKTCRVIYSTIAWQYLSKQARQEGEALIGAAAQNATFDSPLAWLRFEADGKEPGAGIGLQMWPHGIDAQLGRGDFHGRWVDWKGLRPDSSNPK